MAFKFTEEYLKKSLSYEGYIEMTEKLLLEGKTTGQNQEQAMVDYMKLNLQRMKRIFKTSEINREVFEYIRNVQHWVVITEPWCGDAANTVPLIAKIAAESGKVRLHLLLRDKNTEVMNEYLTNGAKSIPILIVLDSEYNELFYWGPRPASIQKMVMDYKNAPGFDIEILKENVQKWYFEDKTVSAQNEIIKKLKKASV